MLQDYHFSKNSLQSQICHSQENLSFEYSTSIIQVIPGLMEEQRWLLSVLLSPSSIDMARFVNTHYRFDCIYQAVATLSTIKRIFLNPVRNKSYVPNFYLSYK